MKAFSYRSHALRSSLYTSFVGWISASASIEYDQVRLVNAGRGLQPRSKR
jgi:hypothetical protein